MTTATAVRPTPDDVTLDEVWRRASKRNLLRQLLVVILGTAFIFALGLVDLNSWPPRRDPDSTSWGLIVVICGGFLVLMLGVLLQRARASRERYVSPLLGLEPDERRTAKQDLRRGRASNDPRLREVEIAQARQRALFGPSSLVAALLPAAVQAATAIIIIASGSRLLGVVFALSVVINGWSSWKGYRDTQDAHRFLDALDGERA